MTLSSVHPDRKAYAFKYLDQFVGCEVEFQTQNNEHLMGMLSHHDPEKDLYVFTNLRKADGKFWAVKQFYTFRDFHGKFIVTGEKDLKPAMNQKQNQVEENLRNDLKDTAINLVSVEDTDIGRIIEDETPEIIPAPDVKDLEFEVIDFNFMLNQDDFECIVSNDVTRHTFPTDPLLSDTINILSNQSLIGLTVLPFSSENRTEPIEFILFGCEKGTFIFTVSREMIKKLKDIFESKIICKVLYDSCITAARLFKLFEIDLNNIDDVLVLDNYFSSKHSLKHRAARRDTRSYSNCVRFWLDEKLPWAQHENFYHRCGKAKLLAAQLDETGRSYARSLVMLLPELRIEALKHIFYPIIQQQFCYSNVIKHASANEYQALRSANLMTPQHLCNLDWGNPEEMEIGGTQAISQMLMKKFRFFSTIRKPLCHEASTQTESTATFHHSPSYRRALGISYPSAGSSNRSSRRSSTVTSGTTSDSSDDCNIKRSDHDNQDGPSSEQSNGQSKTKGQLDELLRINFENSQLSNRTNSDDVDWEKAKNLKLSSELWGIKQPNIMPAGCNY